MSTAYKTPYKSLGHAKKAFGLTFRSGLEAQWAYALHDLRWEGAAIPWEYADNQWFDFRLTMPWGHVCLEIKPDGEEFLAQAVERVPPGEILFIAQGEPIKVQTWGIETGYPFWCVRLFGSFASTQTLTFSPRHFQAMAHCVQGAPFIVNATELDAMLNRRKVASASVSKPKMSDEEAKQRISELRARPDITAYREELKRKQKAPGNPFRSS